MSANWHRLNPQAAKAHRIVRAALKAGRLVKPEKCSKCGTIPHRQRNGASGLQGHHHHGYDRPLEVEWVCSPCHRLDTPKPFGERAGNAKLTATIVYDIRARYAAGESFA